MLDEPIGDDILHQGTCCSATGPAIPFLARLITSDVLPTRQRLTYRTLLYAVTRYAESLVADADRAAGRQRVLQPAKWSADVYEAVGACLPDLLARWENEPEPAQVMLAAFAGMYPPHGRAVTDQIRHLAGNHPNTGLEALPPFANSPRVGVVNVP